MLSPCTVPDHPEMGNIPYRGHQFRIRGYDGGHRSPVPVLGEHNEVLRDILGSPTRKSPRR